ncbi:unnamed protein product [Ceratitis capitata]|uniref:(Mediterranean fruit fly) hypothetical protein n=1 Tax=Ceratitis capitata TaxID=7213 RepID=W8B1P1_CERCA|nr:unnamed protein product [Ceratitis capitata]
MDNSHHSKPTESAHNAPIMDGLRFVTMLPEQLMNWCRDGLDRANESIRLLITTQPQRAKFRDIGTSTEPQLLARCERLAAQMGIGKKQTTNFAQQASTEESIENYDNQRFAYNLDKLRSLLYADDDHMLRQEIEEANNNKNFFKQIDKFLLQHQPALKRTQIRSAHTSESHFSRLFGGGVDERTCCRSTCANFYRNACKVQRSNRTFIEYDWTNYDWCQALREELRRRTKHLNRMKREFKLKTVRVLPNVTHFQ